MKLLEEEEFEDIKGVIRIRKLKDIDNPKVKRKRAKGQAVTSFRKLKVGNVLEMTVIRTDFLLNL